MQTTLQATSTPRPTVIAETPGVSSIEETWEKTLLTPPPDVVPTWCQMRFQNNKKSESSWRVARHGSFQLNKDKMQIKETAEAAHLPVHIHLCEAQTVERSIRSETAKSDRKQPGIKRRREKEEGRN